MRLMISGNQVIDVPQQTYDLIVNGLLSSLKKAAPAPKIKAVSEITHPDYDNELAEWNKYRLVYEGGQKFLESYLKQFSTREDNDDFTIRKSITPIPMFAASNINEIKNSIFSRATDITRKGGPKSYQAAIRGDEGGVNLKGASMNWFIGSAILPELLSMRKVGVYVDNHIIQGSLADSQNKHPYLYIYQAEDIRSWLEADPSTGREFQNVLLRERVTVNDEVFGLPNETITRFRHIFINSDGFVEIQFYSDDNEKIGGPTVLKLKEIPLVVGELTTSLLKPVANHQIALLNMESSDVSYSLRANFPFYTEQRDSRNNSAYLKAAQSRGQAGNDTAAVFLQSDEPYTDNDVPVGATQGRFYPKDMERPGFIAPPTDPLKVSMDKQARLKEDIRVLVHLALSNLQAKMASAESKSLDQQGLEAGLSYIGLELEHMEAKIAKFWSLYENEEEAPTVKYPKKYSIKSSEEVIKEVTNLRELRDDLPSNTFKKEANKRIADLTFSGLITDDDFDKIVEELENSQLMTQNPATLHQDFEDGILDLETYATARNYPPEIIEKAKADHADRLARIQAAQTPAGDMGARGVKDMGADPMASVQEKINKPQRGEGQ